MSILKGLSIVLVVMGVGIVGANLLYVLVMTTTIGKILMGLVVAMIISFTVNLIFRK